MSKFVRGYMGGYAIERLQEYAGYPLHGMTSWILECTTSRNSIVIRSYSDYTNVTIFKERVIVLFEKRILNEPITGKILNYIFQNICGNNTETVLKYFRNVTIEEMEANCMMCGIDGGDPNGQDSAR